MSGGGGGLLAGLGSGVASFFGAKGATDAADIQADALKDANALQLLMFMRTRKDLADYRQLGTRGVNKLLGSIGQLTKPFDPTMAELRKTPGYQFTLDEGLKAAQNAYAAQGLGISGPAVKGAEQYAEGLASTTYQQQLQNYLAQNAQKYNMLMGLTQIGAGAAAGTASAGQFTGAQMGANLASIGNAQAAGTLGAYNAIGQGINNAIGNYYQFGLMNKLYGGA